MHLEKQFDVRLSPEVAAKVAARDETLLGLFPDTKTEIVEREGARRTARSEYTALGRSGVATFHFTVEDDGAISFDKVCDGNVWRELKGKLAFRKRGKRTCVQITLEGRTKPLIPEFTIKGAMQDQIEEMASALRGVLDAEG